jgi:hypothetical protein
VVAAATKLSAFVNALPASVMIDEIDRQFDVNMHMDDEMSVDR